jgi:hypothetical protein
MMNSLKLRITIPALAILCIIMSVSTWRDIKESEKKLLRSQQEKAVLISERISHGIMVLMLKNMWKDLQVMMEGMVKESAELKEIRIFLPEDGRIVASSDPSNLGQAIYHEDLKRYREGLTKRPFTIIRNGEMFASKLTPIENQPICYRCHGSEKKVLGVMDVEVSLASMERSLSELKRQHLFDTIISFLLTGGGFLLIIGLLIDRPMKGMIETIRRIEGGEVARMDESRKDEFGLIARRFNSMLDSLDAAQREIESCHIEQIQRAAKLASLGEIISGIAHEIKNPLTGISCAVQVLHAEIPDDDSRKALTSEILDQIRRLDATVKSLLHYARPKPPRFMPMDVREALEKAVFFIYPEAKKHGVEIETESPDELPPVMMDGDQMQQVFLNLMINAVQAMPDGGKLKITTGRTDKKNIGIDEATKELMAGDDLVEVRFKDSGPGIEPDNMERIFDPFFTAKSKGTGLGLSISRRIVQEHGGEIEVRNAPDGGAAFSVYLPAAVETEAE